MKSISILDAIYWVSQAWNEVEKSTISKCFAKSGFEMDKIAHDNEDNDDDIPLKALKLSRDIFGCEFHELVDIDRNVKT